mgnify:CR=1 FL=1
MLFAIPVIIYKRRWTIRRFLFIARERLERLNPEEGNVGDYFEYDAFVVYSNEDEDRTWVHFQLLRRLENEYKFKLCIHHRDFIGGEDVADNITKAIKSSRKVLAIMSPDFLKSRWCCLEVQMTDAVDPNKLIFIDFQPITRDLNIPAHVSVLMETRTYISWHDTADAQKVFWKRVVKALYNKRKPTRQAGDVNHQAADDEETGDDEQLLVNDD